MLVRPVPVLLGGDCSLPFSPKGAKRARETVQEQTRASPAHSFSSCHTCHGKTREAVVIAKLCIKNIIGWGGGEGEKEKVTAERRVSTSMAK